VKRTIIVKQIQHMSEQSLSADFACKNGNDMIDLMVMGRSPNKKNYKRRDL
jgi:hypothetical protein